MAKQSIEFNGELVQQLFRDPDRLREVLEVICQAPMGLSLYAWGLHFYWLHQHNGSYGPNSFPASAFATEMMWWSIGTVLAVGMAWGIVAEWKRRHFHIT